MKKKIIKADVKSFNKLVEYNYISAEDVEKTDDEDKLIFGSEEGALHEDEEESIDDFDIKDFDDDFDDEEPTEEFEEVGEESFDEPTEEPAEVSDEGEVEVDVTDIVTKSEESSEASQQAVGMLDQLMAKFDELEDRMSNMDVITDKIDSLEQEIEKRNPTPIEKMELRSLDSFPYQVKLDDFWADKEGYEVSNGEEEEEKVYKIDKEEIEATYDEGEARESFHEKSEEDED